jgi:hypothetical protein
VAWNGDRQDRLSRLAVPLSVLLWLGLMAIPPLRELLRLAPLPLFFGHGQY